MKTMLIIQARMGSTRLPGKVLKKILNKSVLELLIERVQRVKNSDGLIIATTDLCRDDVIVELAQRLNVSVFRGSETDVLARYYETAKAFQADAIVRITSDCPLIDPQVIDQVIQFYQKAIQHKKPYDYVSNVLKRSYPQGMDTEIFSFEALKTAHLEAKSAYDREHVTSFFYRSADRFRVANVPYSHDESGYSLTVDTQEDYERVESIFKALYPINPSFNLRDILTHLKKHPERTSKNACVVPEKN